MSQPAKAQEPSMEEILASIRRIIADDETAKPAAPPPPPRPAAPPRAHAPQPQPRPAAPPPPPPPVDHREIDELIAGLEAEAGEQHQQDILDLTEQMAAVDEQPSFQTIDGQSDIVFAEPTPEPPRMAPEPPRRQAMPQPQPHAARPAAEPAERPLLSSVTSAAVDSAFNTLAQTVLVQNARTLEDLVREMLRPMLKSWLDDNLPGMVERIVRSEIERVSRGRG
jgi:cell pole-organizing protein PopZ